MNSATLRVRDAQAPSATALTLLLVRPGATVLDEQGRIKGDLDLPLSPAGQQQVDSLVARLGDLPVDSIYCAPCTCARETAAALAAQTAARVRLDDDLRNLDHGLWQGKRFEELKQTQPRIYRLWAEHPENVAPPFGETYAQAAARIEQFLGRILARGKRGLIAVVVAEPLASMIRARLARQPIENFWQAERQTATWETIPVSPEPPSAK
jgi:broad specificity phosphatase PhoE